MVRSLMSLVLAVAAAAFIQGCTADCACDCGGGEAVQLSHTTILGPARSCAQVCSDQGCSRWGGEDDDDAADDDDDNTGDRSCIDGEVVMDYPDLYVLRSLGNTGLSTNESTGSCGGADAPENVLLFTAPTTGTYAIDTAGAPNDDTEFDTVLYVRSGSCSGSEITNGCNDDYTNLAGDVIPESGLENLSLTGGNDYLIFVDGYNANASGAFRLDVYYTP